MSIDFRLRDFFAPASIWRLHRLFERTQWLPWEELRAVRDGLLRAQVLWAWRRSPYWRDLFERLGLRPEEIRGAEDLKRLPILDRRDLQRLGPRLRARTLSNPVALRTSGTTGEPITLLFDRRANALEFVYYWRHWGWAGYRLGDRFAEISTHFFLLRPQLRGRVVHFQPHLNRLMVSGLALAPRYVDLFARAFRTYRPRFLKGLASELYLLAAMFEERGIDDIALQAVFSTGENLLVGYRRLIERVFHCPVLDSYGQMERTVAICQCPRGGYHLNVDYGILELEDLTGTDPGGLNGTVPKGEGRVGVAVGTSLHNRAMPLFRYRIGDLIEPFAPSQSPPACPCGRTLPLVRAIHGRKRDAILTPDGRTIFSLFLVLELVEGVEFGQFVQEKLDQLEVFLVAGPDYSAESERRLLSLLHRYLGPKVRIRIHYISRHQIPRTTGGKVQPVISRLEAPFNHT